MAASSPATPPLAPALAPAPALLPAGARHLIVNQDAAGFAAKYKPALARLGFLHAPCGLVALSAADVLAEPGAGAAAALPRLRDEDAMISRMEAHLRPIAAARRAQLAEHPELKEEWLSAIIGQWEIAAALAARPPSAPPVCFLRNIVGRAVVQNPGPWKLTEAEVAAKDGPVVLAWLREEASFRGDAAGCASPCEGERASRCGECCRALAAPQHFVQSGAELLSLEAWAARVVADAAVAASAHPGAAISPPIILDEASHYCVAQFVRGETPGAAPTMVVFDSMPGRSDPGACGWPYVALRTALARLWRAPAQMPSEAPLASLGLIADVQYADIDDGASFDGSERRCYRRSLEHAAAAGALFRAARCCAVLQIGDAVDGHNASAARFAAGAGHQGRVALAAVLARLGSGADEAAGEAAKLPVFHAIGNHELLNFERSELRGLLPLPAADSEFAVAVPDSAARGARFYYTARLPGRWRLVVLDAYDIAVGRHGADVGSPQHERALEILRQNNPNECAWSSATSGNYFGGLDAAGTRQRFVPFNGGVGREQLRWLEATLRECSAAGDSAIVAIHIPAFDRAARSDGGPSSIHKCLPFDYDEVLKSLALSPCVSLVLSGHLHEGSFGVDDAGIPHVTLESPLTHAREGAHALLHLFDDRLELQGFGAVASRVVPARRSPGSGRETD